VTLLGDDREEKVSVLDVSVLQVNKWISSNEIWAFVLVELVPQKKNAKEEEIQGLLKEYEDILLCQSNYLHPGSMITTYH
jgi:hypothetical protein